MDPVGGVIFGSSRDDIVYGVRKKRKESWWLRASYHLFYRIMYRLTNLDIPMDAGDFGLLTRRVVDLINDMPEKHRFLRGLRAYVGFKSIAIQYDREPRARGIPKFTISRLFNLAACPSAPWSNRVFRLWSGEATAMP